VRGVGQKGSEESDGGLEMKMTRGGLEVKSDRGGRDNEE